MGFSIYRLRFADYDKTTWNENSSLGSDLAAIRKLEGEEYDKQMEDVRADCQLRPSGLLYGTEHFYLSESEAREAWEVRLHQTIRRLLGTTDERMPDAEFDRLQVFSHLVALNKSLDPHNMVCFSDWVYSSLSMGPFIEEITIEGVNNHTIVAAITAQLPERLSKDALKQARQEELDEVAKAIQLFEEEKAVWKARKACLLEVEEKYYGLRQSIPGWIYQWRGDVDADYLKASEPNPEFVEWVLSKNEDVFNDLQELKRCANLLQEYEDEGRRLDDEIGRRSGLKASLEN